MQRKSGAVRFCDAPDAQPGSPFSLLNQMRIQHQPDISPSNPLECQAAAPSTATATRDGRLAGGSAAGASLLQLLGWISPTKFIGGNLWRGQ